MIRLRERRINCADWRVRSVKLMCLTIFSLLLGGATWRGSLQGKMLVHESDLRYLETIPLNGERGVIWDRNGRILAASVQVYSAYINPSLYRGWEEKTDSYRVDVTKTNIIEGIGVEAERLDEVLRRDAGFAYLRHDILPEHHQRLRELDLPHVGFEKRYRRFYPSAQETAHAIGFVDHEGKGQAGLERHLEDLLAPKSGELQVLRTTSGEVLEVVNSAPAKDGNDLTVTIDSRLQYFAAVAMSDFVEKHGAQSASFVMLDIETGDILAMASVPTYNPNSGVSDSSQRRNRVVQDSFEPGSTVKPLLAAIGIEAGVVKPDTVLNTAKPIRYRGKTITDKKIKTNINLSEAIMRSSNKGMVRVAERLPNEVMWDGLQRFGIGSSTLGWASENLGVLHDHEKWRPIEKATMAYGYFLSSNLLQMVRAYSALGNDGMMVMPRIIAGERREPPLKVVSAETARQVLEMMENVASTKGTAPKASINGFRVAGKTGTSHKRKKDVKGYDTEVYRSLFIGMVPVSNPRFVAGVLVDEPSKGGYYGGTVAAPIFAEVVGHALQLYAVSPDRMPEDEQLPSAAFALAHER